MKKQKFDGRGAEECKRLDWVELSETLEAKGSEESPIVNETISQIVSEDLKVDTQGLDGVRDAVDSFYAYDKKPSAAKKVKKSVADNPVDEKIIIRSEELKKKRSAAKSSASKSAASKSTSKSSASKSGTSKSTAAKAASAKGSVAKSKTAKKSSAHRSSHVGPERSNDSFRHVKGLDKYRKMGVLPTKADGPSDFRKKSADWKDEEIKKAEAVDNGIIAEDEDLTFGEKLKNMSVTSILAYVMAGVLFITSLMTTTVYADYRGEQSKAMAMANLPSFVDDVTNVAYNGDIVNTQEFEMEDAASEMPASENRMLSLILTSVEKDLKVKLVDDEDTLVKGVKWGITVTDDKDKESTYEDEDEDGVIHLTGMNAGDYSVAITDTGGLDGYLYPTVGQKVSVKAKVEYKVIANIKDEIKKESEVNAAAEDNGNKAADVETGTALTDTVEFVESSRQENGETYEEAIVDLSKTEIIASVGGRLVAALKSIADAANTFTSGTLANIGTAPLGRMVALDPSGEENANGSGSGEETKPEVTATPTPTATPAPAQPDQSSSQPEAARPPEGQQNNISMEEMMRRYEEYRKAKEARENQTPTPTPTLTPTPTPAPSNITDLNATPTPVPLDIQNQTVDTDSFKPEAQLYDSAKNELYVYEDGNYRLAKFADYKSGNFSKYYRKVVGFIYTGWQNIDGKNYYYNKDHQFVTGDQIIGGVSYKFNSDGSLDNGSGVLGIDVSKYQPSINWSSVKASGVDFVIIRCGYRGASTGALIQDPYFTSHIKGAKSVGLKVGVYFFSTALNEAEAVEEASMCAALCGDYGINYPVFLDVESSSRPGYNTLSAAERTANIQAFCKTISSAGYTPGLYANKTWLTEKINTSSLSCKIWLAQYRAEGPTYNGRYDIWQYTSKGTVDGISGNVDMNKSFLNY